MSTKKQREVFRRRRMEFDRRVYENRKKAEEAVETPVKKKRGRPRKVKTDDVSGTDK